MGLDQSKTEADQIAKMEDNERQHLKDNADRELNASQGQQKSKLEAMKIKAMKDKRSK